MRPTKLVFALLFISLLTNTAFSQAERIYMLDENSRETEKPKKAKLLLREKKVSDTCWQRDTYNFSGPLIKTERFKDKEGSIAHGKFVFFNPARGHKDSVTYFADGLAHGDWSYYNDTGRAYLLKKYNHGILIETVDLIKKLEEDKLKADTSKKRDEKESEFPGGEPAWKKYLEKTVRYPERALKLGAKGEVRVQFIVDKEGKLSDIEINRSVEFSIDEEAMRIIRKSPQWIPAVQDGRIVKSYKIQPLTFFFR